MEQREAKGGSVLVGQTSWGWAEQGAACEFWCQSDEPQDPAALLDGAKWARAEMSSDLVVPRARTLPSTFAVLGEILALGEALGRYDTVLLEALRFLGVDGAKSMCDYGMPSEYRGWLAWAREKALKALPRLERDASRRDVAEEIMMGTCAVAFSMRFGHVNTPFTIAVAIDGLRKVLPKATVADNP
jgi:hypothetical protein